MPKYWSGKVIVETPEHLLDDLGMAHKNELIAAPLKSVVNQRKKYCQKLSQNIVEFFHEVKAM